MQWSDYSLKFEELPNSKIADTGPSTNKSVTKNRTIFRKVMTETASDLSPRRLLREEIEIDCLELREIFTGVCRHRVWPLPEHGPIVLRSPFTDFVWFWDDFKAACNAQPGDTDAVGLARQDLSQLLELLEHSQLEPYFSIRESSLASGTMPYEYLWTLFPPGSKVYTKALFGEMQMLEVRSCDYPIYTSLTSSYTSSLSSMSRNQPEWIDPSMTVQCGGFDWDGSRFNAFSYGLRILKDYKQTAMTIDALEAFPTRFFRDSNGERNDTALRAKLISRGERYGEICSAEADRAQYRHQGVILADVPAEAALALMQAPRLEEEETRSLYSGLDAAGAANDKNAIYMNKTEYRGVVLADVEGFIQSQRGSINLPLGYITGTPLLDNLCQW